MSNALATTISRRAWLRRMIMAAVASVVGARLADPVDAEKSPGSYQNAFTKACRERGGTPKRVRSRVVKCTLTDGTVITCDFNVNPPNCTKALTHPPTKPGGGGAVPPSGGSEDPTDPSSPVTEPVAPPAGGNEQPSGGDAPPSGGGGQPGGGGAVGPGGSTEQPSAAGSGEGGGVILYAGHGGTPRSTATRPGAHRRPRRGTGRRR